jgi:hypothetical protein
MNAAEKEKFKQMLFFIKWLAKQGCFFKSTFGRKDCISLYGKENQDLWCYNCKAIEFLKNI